jgi:hypothetical protein
MKSITEKAFINKFYIFTQHINNFFYQFNLKILIKQVFRLVRILKYLIFLSLLKNTHFSSKF